ncbi:segregation/condensation protein A [Alphaproteobacteria bacterium]|jgi:segregation and condensation protein A|nr:segregation/condensation protein A [Alphaproteobacteria bacterium]
MSENQTDQFEEDVRRQESSEQLSLFVNLDGFEGPIDLLLALAREQKVDLARIAILPLAEQYLDFIERARRIDLEIAADFLVIAAWLAYLKSRLLLPDPEPELNEEVVDMTDALKYQLMRLESMQQASKRLMSLPRLGQQRFARGEIERFETISEPVWTATLYDLLACYGSIRSSVENRTLTISASRLFSVEEAAARLRRLVGHVPDWTLLETFLPPGLKTPLDRRSATASHFVASLELAREGVLNLRQDSRFAPIFLRVKDSA